MCIGEGPLLGTQSNGDKKIDSTYTCTCSARIRTEIIVERVVERIDFL